MIGLMGLEATVAATRHPGGWTLRVGGPARQALTKRDGELLHAVEFLLNRMARRAWPDAGSIRLAVGGFRDRRDEDIIELAREVAAMVARSGRAEVLHEMNPYERRLVHLTAREYPDLRTVSEGDGFLKRIRIEKDRG